MNLTSRYAMLIDAENIPSKLIACAMKVTETEGYAAIRRVYANWASSKNTEWKQITIQNGLMPIQQHYYTGSKNAVDIAIVVDAMDILHDGMAQGFYLVTSDSDFTRLAIRLREGGARVVGMGERKTPRAFVAACDLFVYLDDLYAESQRLAREEQAKRAAALEAATQKIVEAAIQLPEPTEPEPTEPETTEPEHIEPEPTESVESAVTERTETMDPVSVPEKPRKRKKSRKPRRKAAKPALETNSDASAQPEYPDPTEDSIPPEDDVPMEDMPLVEDPDETEFETAPEVDEWISAATLSEDDIPPEDDAISEEVIQSVDEALPSGIVSEAEQSEDDVSEREEAEQPEDDTSEGEEAEQPEDGVSRAVYALLYDQPDGWLYLPLLGKRLAHLVPGFHPREQGYATMADFLRSLSFCEVRDRRSETGSGGLYVRLRTDAQEETEASL